MSEHKQSEKVRLPKLAWILIGVSIAILGAIGSCALWLYVYATTPAPKLENETVTIFIPRGMPTTEIISELADSQLIRQDLRLFILMKYHQNELNLQAGEFALHTNQTPIALLKELSTARPVEYQITLPEGFTVEETAALFAQQGWADSQRFVQLCYDPTFIAELELPEVASLEGYLFPDTYNFKKPRISEERLIKMLVDRSTKVYQKLVENQQRSTALTRHQIYTLASIVEKESAQDAEREIIASVFLNRLKKKMRLQSDPTVYYGLGMPKRKLTRKDLADQSPYNTYVIKGLPPGPICSPGAASLVAVLSPAETDYYYFVAKNDGSHQFSKNLSDHNRAVRKYQR